MDKEKDENCFKFLHWNPNSINNKICEFLSFLELYSPELVAINETKCNDVSFRKLFAIHKLEGYKIEHKERKNGQGGGVAFLIKENVNYSLEKEYDSFELELLCLKINLKNSNFLVFSYYNPPNIEPKKEFFEKLYESKVDFVLAGDLNSKSKALNCVEKNPNGFFLDKILLNSNFCVLNDKSPTHCHFTTQKEDILDLFIASPSFYSKKVEFSSLKKHDMGSDHYPVLLKLKFKFDLYEKDIYNLKKLDLNKAEWDKFRGLLPKEVPNEIKNNLEKFNQFITESLVYAATNSIPTFKIRNFKKTLPYYILELIDEKHRAKNRLKKHNNPENKARFNLFTKLVREEIAAFRDKNWQDFLDKINKNVVSSKHFWRKVNRNRNDSKKSSKNGQFPKLTYNGKEYNTEMEKVELFGKLLEETFKDKNLNNYDNKHKEKVEEEVANYLTKERSNEASFKISELEQAINKLNISSAPGPDNIHNLYLINSSDDFKKLILDLLNLSARTNALPNEWKIARISMIPKKKANSPSPKDYRPVSVTSCLGKLSERLVLKRLNTFIEENELIIKQQSGFRKHRQTRDNLFHFIQKTIETFERKKKVCAIFFDIQAAFDKVWHKGLLYKMIKMKIPIDLILWLRAFLENRKFFVNIGNTQSKLYDIKAGVPQGAVLSPLLFSIYINDIPTKYNKNKSYSLLFADDLVSYFIFNKYNNIQKMINGYIRNIEQWLSLWRLSMAAEKCNYIIFSSTKKNLTKKLKFKMFNRDLTPSDNICFLGIRFDHSLSFKNQVEFLKKNCQQRLNCLKILSHKSWKLSKNTLKQIYFALVRSVLDYSSVILPRLSATNLKNLQRIQNCAIKVIFKLNYRENTQNIHRIAGIKVLEDRYRELNENYLSDSIQNKNPLINDLINEYKLFKRGRINKLKFDTFLGSLKV